ncbi:MAG: sirohydrochlorin chelatase [Opitutales bacterium]
MIQDNNSAFAGEFHKSSESELFWLTDNGSLRPEATLMLRALSKDVSQRLGREVLPVSLLHSSKIDPELLDGKPAQTFERSVKAAYEAGKKNINIQPLFFGPSAALTEYLPERIRILSKKREGLKVEIARPLVQRGENTPDWLLDILEDFAHQLKRDHPEIKNWLLVDHGSPRKEVAEVRDRIAEDFNTRWRANHPGERVKPASMERREGEAYAFCDPLLENAPEAYGFEGGAVGVLMLFFLPGRHAGPCGDVAEIIEGVEERMPGLKLYMSPLFSEHPKLAQVLAERIGLGRMKDEG